MAQILRGEIYWADLSPVRGREQAGLRPVLILSQDVFSQLPPPKGGGLQLSSASIVL